MLTIITGRAGTGKTAEIYRRIKLLAEKGERGILIIVPEQFSHEAERELCRVCGNSISLHAEVLSFSRLCSRVFSEAGGLALKPLDSGGRVLIMSMAMMKVSRSLKAYNLGRRRPEFLQRLIATKDELKTAGVTGSDLLRAAETQTGSLADKLSDMYAIYTAYDALIPKDMCDPYDRLDMLLDAIDGSEAGSGEIFVDGFTTFTAQEMRIVERLAEKCRNMTVCLTSDGIYGGETQFEAAAMTGARLMSAAARANIKTKIIDKTEREKATDEMLVFLEKYLFADIKPEYTGKKGSVRAFFADTQEMECELAASTAVKLVRDTGCRWRDVAVAVCGWEDYRSAAQGIFEKYGVPYFTYDKVNIMQKPVTALIASALDVISGGWEYEDVFRYLKTGLANIDVDGRDILENYVYKWNIRGAAMWTRDEDWTASPSGYDGREKDPELLDKINRLRRQVSAPLGKFELALKKAGTADEKVRAVYSFAEDIGLADTIGRMMQALDKSGELQAADEYRQLWGILVDAMEQCASVLAGVEIENEEFFKLFKLLLSQYDVGTIPASLDTVGVGDISRMRRRGIKHLIVIGASDDRLPSIAQSGGILSDIEKDILVSEAGFELNDTPHRRLMYQMESIYGCITQPSETLTVSYPLSSGGGRPSFIYSGICSGLGIEPERACAGIRKEALLPCFELACAGDMQAKKYFESRAEWKSRLELAVSAASIPRGRLRKETASKLYSKNINVTASRVDKYYGCKFAYFLQYGLKAKPRNKAGFEAPEAGTFIHYILENVTREVMENDGGFKNTSREFIAKKVQEYSEIYAEKMLEGFKDKSKRFIYLFGRLTEYTSEIAASMAEELAESDFAPVDFELDFSRGGDMPPALVADGDRSVSVSGKVDRVDSWIHDGKIYLRVIDYKTGRKEFSLSDVLYGLGLQMLIYLFVLQKSGSARYGGEVVPAGVLYMPARDVILSMDRNSSEEQIAREREKAMRRHGIILDDEAVIQAMEHGKAPKYIPVKFSKDGKASTDSLADMEKLGMLSKYIDKLLLEMGRSLADGDITADPYFKGAGENACLYCDYYDICRFGDESGDRRRYISKLKPYEAWNRIESAGGEDDRA